jgi:hypothetical protein
MTVVIDIEAGTLTATKEKGDPKFKDSGWGSGESRLLHHIKLALIEQGHDVIKKRMWKDGHLYGDEQTQYIRTRSKKSPKPHIYIYDHRYALRNSAEDFNKDGQVTLRVTSEVFE